MTGLVDMETVNRLTGEIVDAALRVHSALGPGLLERVYVQALALELRLRGIDFELERRHPIYYRGHCLDSTMRFDILVGGCVIVEVKAVPHIDGVHLAQVLTYLKLSAYPVALLINFNVPLIKDGIRRLIAPDRS